MNFRHALRCVALIYLENPRIKNKQRISFSREFSFLVSLPPACESLALGNFNNLLVHLPEHRHTVMVSIWRPRFHRVSVNYILRWYCARLCARSPTLQRHIRPLLCCSRRNRVHATTKRHIASLLTFACVPHVRSGHMSER